MPATLDRPRPRAVGAKRPPDRQVNPQLWRDNMMKVLDEAGYTLTDISWFTKQDASVATVSRAIAALS